ncbi:MAG: M48 family metallopeptidase, partial [Lautropia sp.]
LDRVIGEQVAASLDGSWLEPTQLPADRRERIALALEAAVAAAWPDSPPPAYQLRFARSRIGPNALALPGGQIVVTDELIRLADRAGQDATPMLVGVLGHELGHVVHRHGLRAVVQAGLVAGVAAVALGDFSGLLAGAPAVLAQQGYSRDFEREADRESVRILRAGGYSPALMARFFELIAEARRDPQQAGMMARIAVALASHPADAERIRFFRAAAGAVQ